MSFQFVKKGPEHQNVEIVCIKGIYAVYVWLGDHLAVHCENNEFRMCWWIQQCTLKIFFHVIEL